MAKDKIVKEKQATSKPLTQLTGFFQIDTYSVLLERSRATILCERSSPRQRLFIYFYNSGDTIPDNFCDSKQTTGRIHTRAEEYIRYIDILRNEKPVYALISSDNPRLNRIQTSAEPIGEEESS